MIVDYLRSAYSTTCYFKKAGHASTIRWYRAPPGALALPFRTIFGSLNWSAPQVGTNDLGEVYHAARPWGNGAAPAGVVGNNYCGTEVEFAQGLETYLGSDRPVWDNGLPQCCTPPPPPPPECVPWTFFAERYASWDATGLLLPSFGDPYEFQQGYYEPDTLNGYYWAWSSAVDCGGSFGSEVWAFLNNTVDGQWKCDIVSYDPVTGESSWRAPPDSGYRPGELFFIGPLV